MIVTKNWLNEWINLDEISTNSLVAALNEIGLEVDSCKEFVAPKGVVVGKVIEREDHQNSDKLSICKVDVGKEILQIVCGAKNVAKDQFVAVSLVGAKIGDLEIKPVKLRGVDSFGMICSSNELGFPKLNDGIMVLDESIGELVLGKELREFGAFCDVVIEIGLTPNRGDCLSIHGVARDLSAKFDLPLKDQPSYVEEDKLLGIGRIISLHAEQKLNGSLSYKALQLKDEISINLDMSLRLALVENLKQNAIENLLSYATYSTGVIFRAYDFGKISKDQDKVTITIVDENGKYKLSSNSEFLGYVGIYQEPNFKPDNKSELIIIEASYVEPNAIVSSMGEDKGGKKDEISYRSSRGSEPKLSFGLDFLFQIFSNYKFATPYAGAQQIIFDQEPHTITFSVAPLCKMIGFDVARNDIIKILKKLGFDVSFNTEQEQIYAKIPSYRHDVLNLHDICEEIVRIIGIDNIKSAPLNFSEKNRINASYQNYQNSKILRQNAVNNGFFECVHYAFDNLEELSNLGFKPCKIDILNPINNELNTLKPTLLNHLLKSSQRNVRNSKKCVKLFEFGDVFDENGKQSKRISFLHSGLKSEPSLVNGAKISDIDFLNFAKNIQNVVGKITLKTCDNIVFLNKFEQALIYKNGINIGFIGRLDINLENKKELPRTYLCEIDFDKIEFKDKFATAYSKFPPVSRDLSFVVSKDFDYQRLKECILDMQILSLKEFYPVDTYTDDSLGENMSLTIKFSLQDENKTFDDTQIVEIMDKITNGVKNSLGIGLR